MEEYKVNSGYGWHAWFWVDKEEFEGGWKAGSIRYRVEKAVGRADDGKLFLMVWTNQDRYDWHKFSQVFYEIDGSEYAELLDRAIKQGELTPNDREHLMERMKAPFIPPWDVHKDVVVYRDGRYTLGQQNGLPYLIANGERFTLTCHPYEPCLYITDENGCKTAVHNAFDPFDVLDAFSRGETITSITGREYGALDFCRIVEYAAGMSDIGINDAEAALGCGKKRKKPEKKNEEKEDFKSEPFHPEAERVITDDPAYAVINEYPDSAVEYLLVKNEHAASGRNAHWYALVWASRALFFDGEEQIWRYDCRGAEGKRIAVDALFAAANEKRGSNYRGAFLYPPHGGWFGNADFDRVNAALFPNGTDGLEVYEWTTDWSEFFDDGHEWWGALCFTVYDKTLDRFAVIMASATD
ncbi:MAG: hypothetical protein IJQ53_03795 [Clostridia bacterium]|nr:hypothetical protein [Clostridia bacterium]